jgi:hypothetical protein
MKTVNDILDQLDKSILLNKAEVKAWKKVFYNLGLIKEQAVSQSFNQLNTTESFQLEQKTEIKYKSLYEDILSKEYVEWQRNLML